MKKINLDMKESKRMGMPCWMAAFLLSLAGAVIAILPFLLRDEGYIAMSHDFTAQEIAFHTFMNETVRSGNLLWNWAIDLGGNFLESFSFYNLGSAFSWISFLFPPELTPRVMGVIMILKFAVAGAAAAGYLNRHIKNRTIVLLASLLYAFSGFQCSSVVFYHFQDAVAFFPLMLTGLELLVEEKKRGRLLAACVVNVLCNYSFFISGVIFLVIYYVVKYMIPDIQAGKRGIRHYAAPIIDCMIEGALGCMAAGILLIPSIISTLSNERVTSHILGEEWLTMTTKDWLMLLKAFLMPAETMDDYSSVTTSDWMTNAAYLPLFSIVFVLAYLFKKKDWLSHLIKTCFVIALIPVLNSVFMTFMPGGYRRWYYMFILVMVVATAKVIEAPKEYPIKKALGVWGALFGVYLLLTCVVPWSEQEQSIIYNRGWYLYGVITAFVGIVLLYAVFRWVKTNRNMVLLLLVFVFSVGTLGVNIHHYQSTTDNSNLDFKTYPNSYAKNVANYLTEIPQKLDREILPYRYYFDEGIGHTYYNLELMNSLPSINSFISTAHASITEFYDQLGIGRGTWTNGAVGGVRELLSARYIVSAIEQPAYTYLTTLENSNGQQMYLYENEAALPIGFTYDSYIKRSEFENLGTDVRAVVMLKTLVIEDEDEAEVSKYLFHYPEYGEVINVDSLPGAIAERGRETSEEFRTGDNYFESVITADAEKYAFFAVPYDKYWRAEVNGEEREVLNINGLMAVRIDGGENRILFEYEYLPIQAGAVCSIAGVLASVLYLILAGRLEKNKRD